MTSSVPRFEYKFGVVRIVAFTDHSGVLIRRAITGTGFLVSKAARKVVTCAHVVSNAQSDLSNDVGVEFWCEGFQRMYRAQVVAEGWRSPSEGDIAVLEIIDSQPIPADVKELPLGTGSYLRPGDKCESFGFPPVTDRSVERELENEKLTIENDGKASLNTVIGYNKRWRKGRVFSVMEIESNQATYGFSGAPIWDDNSACVVGILTEIVDLNRDEEGGNVTKTIAIMQAGRSNRDAYVLLCISFHECCPDVPLNTVGPPLEQQVIHDSVPNVLQALSEVAQLSETRGELKPLAKEFSTLRENMRIISAYKVLHSELQTFQFFCQTMKEMLNSKSPITFLNVEDLADSAKRLIQNASPYKGLQARALKDMFWIATLEDAVKILLGSGPSSDELFGAVELFFDRTQRVVVNQSVYIDRELTARIKNTRFEEACDGLIKVCDLYEAKFESNLSPNAFKIIRDGSTSIRTLGSNLRAHAEWHGTWQGIDIAIYTHTLVAGELIDFWRSIREPLDTIPLNSDLLKSINDMEECLRLPEKPGLEEVFHGFSRRARMAFHKIDSDLKTICTILQKFDDPIESLLLGYALA